MTKCARIAPSTMFLAHTAARLRQTRLLITAARFVILACFGRSRCVRSPRLLLLCALPPNMFRFSLCVGCATLLCGWRTFSACSGFHVSDCGGGGGGRCSIRLDRERVLPSFGSEQDRQARKAKGGRRSASETGRYGRCAQEACSGRGVAALS